MQDLLLNFCLGVGHVSPRAHSPWLRACCVCLIVNMFNTNDCPCLCIYTHRNARLVVEIGETDFDEYCTRKQLTYTQCVTHIDVGQVHNTAHADTEITERVSRYV